MNTINYSKNIVLVAIAAVGIASLAVNAQADESSFGVNSQTVNYSDLNLNTQAGAKAFYRRLRNAAQQVCGDVGSHQLQEAAAAQACVDRAIAASLHAVKSVQVTREAKLSGAEAKADARTTTKTAAAADLKPIQAQSNVAALR